jgi:uncharacterized protein YcbK (DUF882 family)
MTTTLDRRLFLGAGLAAAFLAAPSSAEASRSSSRPSARSPQGGAQPVSPRGRDPQAVVRPAPRPEIIVPARMGRGRIRMVNPNTREVMDIVYRRRNRVDAAAMRRISTFFRDWRQGRTSQIDIELVDALSEAQARLGGRQFHLLSGYRTPPTNAMVGGANDSYHMRGMAADIRVPEVSLSRLHDTFLDLKVGGVGFYPQNGFCHLDVGDVRQWVG